MVTIREVCEEDADRIEEVHETAIRRLGRSAYTEQQVAAWVGDLGTDDSESDASEEADETMEDENDGYDGVVLVAETDGQIVGFGQVVPSDAEYLDGDDPNRGEVRAVYVHPDAARRGIGTALLTALETRAREADVSRLGLHASLNAVPFYEARGYDRVRNVEHEFGDTGVTGTVVEMQKRV